MIGIDAAARTITVDLIELLTGAEAQAEWEAHGGDPGEGRPTTTSSVTSATRPSAYRKMQTVPAQSASTVPVGESSVTSPDRPADSE